MILFEVIYLIILHVHDVPILFFVIGFEIFPSLDHIWEEFTNLELQRIK